MDMPPSEQWSIEVVESGRSGSIEYREPAGCISFYWEFGGGDTVAIIWVGDLALWNTKYPWAIDHRRAILERVAHEIVRRKAPSCRADIDEKGGYIYLREPGA
jgi:hypothetical protein